MRAALLVVGIVLCCACGAASSAGKGPRWRTSSAGVQVFLGPPPGGVKRVIGTVYADAHSEPEAVEALAAEARRIHADAIYGVQESALPGLARRPGLRGAPSRRGGIGPGDFSSERHIRSWQATAVVLEPAPPAEREDPAAKESPSPETPE